jgi:hypothetical protein
MTIGYCPILTNARPRGSAPVFDSCGRAGGHLPTAMSGKASFGGVYINTTHAKLGDDGAATTRAAMPSARTLSSAVASSAGIHNPSEFPVSISTETARAGAAQ